MKNPNVMRQNMISSTIVRSIKKTMEWKAYEAFTYLIGLTSNFDLTDMLDVVVHRSPKARFLDIALGMHGGKLDADELVKLVLVSYDNEYKESGVMLQTLLERLAALTDVSKYEDRFYSRALLSNNGNIFRVLLHFYPDMHKRITWDTVLKAVKDGADNLILPMLEYVDPSVKNNELLYVAVLERDVTVVVQLLNDPRVSPTEVLTRLYLPSAPGALREDASFRIAILARDERVDINSLDDNTIDGLVKSVLHKDSREGYDKAWRLAIAYTAAYHDVRGDIVATITGVRTLYSLALAMLALKIQDRSRVPLFPMLTNNTSLASSFHVDLFDWMIAQNNPQFQQAASNVLANLQVSNWIEALMTVALHKSATVTQVIDEMQRTSSQADVLAAAKIVGLYLGKKEIKMREANKK
ncbi:Hypothetical protein POVR2_LOCUS127 [uncultured virus]|nr:Hypothetical protein POVR2_LOCUS127 [uncultured virus]